MIMINANESLQHDYNLNLNLLLLKTFIKEKLRYNHKMVI